MNNIYDEPGATTEERHALNNTRSEMQAGLGNCQMGIETDELRIGFKDHLGDYHSTADAVNEFKVKVNHDTAGGYLENVLVPATNSPISLNAVGDTLEADVTVDDSTIENNSGELRVKPEGITDAEVASANKNGVAGAYCMRTLGAGSQEACAGDDARLSDARTPTAHATSHEPGGGDAMAVDAAAGTGSLRTLGVGGTNACAGNDARLSDARTPTAHKTTHEPGGSDAMTVDAAAATGSLRTIGTGALQACAGNDSRLSDARTPTAHASTHNAGGGDAMAIDSAAGTGSLRTIGTGALQACAGNDSRLSDYRQPNKLIITKTYINTSGITTAIDISVAVVETGYAYTLTKVQAKRTGGTGATVNTSINGSNNRSSDLSLTTTSWTDFGTLQNTAGAAGNDIQIRIMTASGNPTQIVFQLEFTRAAA